MMDVERPTLRERNKTRTRERIRAAAEQVFQEKGVGAATIRDVAERAEVGLRTVFLYARDKRDLLFLVLNEGIDRAFAEGRRDADADGPLFGVLAAVFAPMYPHLLERLPLARAALRELVFSSAGDTPSAPSSAFFERRQLVHGWLVELLGRARDRGAIAPPDALELVASSLQSVFLIEIRTWLMSDGPQVADGVERLQRLFRLQVEGLHPA